MRKTSLLTVILLVFGVGASVRSFGQFSAVTQSNAQILAQKLVGTGIQISNVTMSGAPAAFGTFVNNQQLTNLRLDSGIVLCTGLVSDIPGNSSFNASTINSTPGDLQLSTYITPTPLPTAIHDAAILEFDFIPTGDTVRFKYVMASEEYPEYACSQFTDAFGFFISGPGFPTPYNMAKVPNTNIAVAINSINSGAGNNGTLSTCNQMGPGSPFGQYYIDNQNTPYFRYDGLTKQLVATTPLTPCQTYHLKLVIMDVGDASYDSGVFIEAKSLTSNNITNSIATQAPPTILGSNVVVEGCQPGNLRINRTPALPTPQAYTLTCYGTAINGVDVQTIPTTVNVPANATFVDVPIVPIVDNIAEGTETLNIKIGVVNVCGVSVPFDTAHFTVRDFDTIIVSPHGGAICANTATQITLNTNLYTTFQWTPTTGVSNPTIGNPLLTPLDSVRYVMIASFNDCRAIDSFMFRIKKIRFIDKVDVNCQNGNTGIIHVGSNNVWGGGVQYNIGNGPWQSDSTFTGLAVGTYVVHIRDNAPCMDSVVVTINQAYPNLGFTDALVGPVCQGQGTVQLTPTGGKPPYQFAIDGSVYSLITQYTLPCGIHTVSVKDSNGCVYTNPVNIPCSPVISAQIINLNPVNAAGQAYLIEGCAWGGVKIKRTPVTASPLTVNLTFGGNAINGTDVSTVPTTVTIPANDSVYVIPISAIPDFVTEGIEIFKIFVQPVTACPGPMTDSITIYIKEWDTVAITPHGGFACGTNPVQLNISPTYGHYLWTPSAGISSSTSSTPMLTPVDSMKYVLLASDSTCRAMDSVMFRVKKLTFVSKKDVNCQNGATGEIKVSGGWMWYGAPSSVQFNINNGPWGPDSTFTNLPVGTYVVHIKDGTSCTDSVTVNIVQAYPNLGFTEAVLTPTCNGVATVQMTGNGGLAPYQFQIDGAGLFSNTTTYVLPAGNHIVVVKDTNSCTSTHTVVLPPPTIIVAQIINQNTVNASGQPYIIEGCAPGGVKIKRTPAAAYPLTVNLTFGGTATNGTDLTTVPSSVIIPANDSVVTVPLSAIADFVAEGIETFKIYAAPVTACSSTTITDSFLVYIKEWDTVTIAPHGGFACGTNPVQLTISPSFSTYQWTPAMGFTNATTSTPSLTPVDSMTYVLMAASNGSCRAMDSVMFRVKKLTFVSKKDVNCQNGATGEIRVKGGWMWYSAGSVQYNLNNGAYQADSTFTGLTVGTYVVHIKDLSGCTDSVTVNIVQSYPNLSFIDTTLTPYCQSLTPAVQFTGAGGLAPYQYSTDGGATYSSSNIFNLAGGTYNVNVKDTNGCVNTHVVTVLANVPSTVTIINPIHLNGAGKPYLVEGCAPGTLTLKRTPVLSTPLTVNITFSGTAINGTDVVTIPNSVIIPANDSVVTVPITTIVDNVTEGREFLRLAVAASSSCDNGTVTDTTTIQIWDYDTLDLFPRGGIICNNTPVSMNIANAYNTYQWSPTTGVGNPNVASPMITPVDSLLYTILTSTNDCHGLDSVRFRVKKLSFFSQINVKCQNGTTGEIRVGGGYLWSPTVQYNVDNTAYQSDSTFTGLTVGPHVVRIKDGTNCIDSLTITITQLYPNLNFTSSMVNPQCHDTIATMQFTGVGGLSPYQLSAMGSAYSVNNIYQLPNGADTIRITDANSCVFTMPVNVYNAAPPTITGKFLLDSANCTSDGHMIVQAAGPTSTSFQYAANGGNYQISDTLSAQGGLMAIITAQDNNNCLAIDSLFIPLNNNLTLVPGPNRTICEGDSVHFEATSNGSTVLWTGGAVSNPAILTPNASPVDTTKYYITASLGVCPDKTDSVRVNVWKAPIPVVDADYSLCIGKDSVLHGSAITSVGVSQYSWKPTAAFTNSHAQNEPIRPPRTQGYSLDVVDTRGCHSLAPALVTVTITPGLILFIGADTIVAINQPLQLHATPLDNTYGALHYTWSPSYGLDDPNSQNPVAYLDHDILPYTVTAVSANGCSGSARMNVKVYRTPDIYVPDAFTPNHDGKNDLLKAIPVGIASFHYFNLYNRWGQLVFSTSNSSVGWDGTLNGHEQGTATYIWVAEGVDYHGNLVQRKGAVTLIK